MPPLSLRVIPWRTLAFGASSSLLMTSCFHTSGRLSLAGEREKETVVQLSAGDVRFAADVEVRGAEHAVARIDVDLLARDQIVAHATCDPLKLSDRRACVYRFGNHDFACSVVMQCRAHVDASGPVLVRARLSIPKRPAEFEIERADLIIGQ